jgi:transposase
MGTRRRFSREFKVEAVKLVCERGVTVSQASRDLDIHVNVLRGWVRAHREDPSHAFPGEGQQKPEAGGSSLTHCPPNPAQLTPSPSREPEA